MLFFKKLNWFLNYLIFVTTFVSHILFVKFFLTFAMFISYCSVNLLSDGSTKKWMGHYWMVITKSLQTPIPSPAYVTTCAPIRITIVTKLLIKWWFLCIFIKVLSFYKLSQILQPPNTSATLIFFSDYFYRRVNGTHRF